MTIESNSDREQYDTNGTTGPWTVHFYFLQDQDLDVVYADADGAETPLSLNTGYTVAGAGSPYGGSITTVTAYPAGGTITILRDVEALQETNYVETDSFPAASHERALDKLTMLAQQLSERSNRALSFPRSVGNVPFLPSGALAADRMLAFSLDGNSVGIANFTQTQIGSAVSAAYAASALADAVNFLPQGFGAVGRSVQAKLRETITPADYSTLALAGAAALLADSAVRFNTDATINIPTDAPTLQTVFNRCVPGRLGMKLTVNIESGHQLAVGAVVEDGDYSCFEIVSEDAVVDLAPGWPANTCILEGRRARMPAWSILVDCGGQSVGGNDGFNLGALAARENSDLFVAEGAGVINNGSGTCANIMIARDSRLTAAGADFSGAAFRNGWFTHASTAYAELCDFTNAGGAGVFVSRASVLYGTGSDFSGSGEEGVLCYRSIFMAVASGSTVPRFENCGTHAILAQQASRVICRERAGFLPVIDGGAFGIRLEGGSRGDLNGCSFANLTSGTAIQLVGASMAEAKDCLFDTIAGICLAADGGSILDAADGTFTDVVNLLQAQGGEIIVNNSTATGITGTAIYALNGGTVKAINATFPNAGIHGINCEGGNVHASGIDVSGAGTHCVRAVGGYVDVSLAGADGAGANGISAQAGAIVNATGGNFSGAGTTGIGAVTGADVKAAGANAQNGGAPSTSDVSIATGSIIRFAGGTGGVSTAVNTLTAAGIIFR